MKQIQRNIAYPGMMEYVVTCGYKAKLPHWPDNKYIFWLNNWTYGLNLGISHLDVKPIPFLAIKYSDKIGPITLHDCDITRKDWIIYK
jgi:hypothetical protein